MRKNSKSIEVADFVQITFTFLFQILHAAIFSIVGKKRRKGTLKRQNLKRPSRDYQTWHDFCFSSERKFCPNEHNFQRLSFCKRVIRTTENTPSKFCLEII